MVLTAPAKLLRLPQISHASEIKVSSYSSCERRCNVRERVGFIIETIGSVTNLTVVEPKTMGLRSMPMRDAAQTMRIKAKTVGSRPPTIRIG